ncbi:hypothetical protein HIO71_13885 [Chryseobacterium aquaticum]|jgi:hypothetical protein|uniref:Uncharacterized protein n=3 Tax=Chryseobacterium TaxID=59732 RepID=A0A848NCR4_9FLAO|nr:MULTISPECIES: hypothetical protein [Chryseobacterium]MDV3993870.1 hypothetical protein [Elizabethkingia anophelis]AZA79660.1 hypothetical protein EG347_20310 [Chryseobacterium sp. G0186]AZB35706.1 hypothetical protein EG351_20365 [Chryseobacterium bernardetii]EFK35944.1 hypothetical protein HMPREF0204_15013 [Chryseobacterium gleum ATCC 35910]NMR35273.1 hypothetical protein [Chryseobacterium aquaticum]
MGKKEITISDLKLGQKVIINGMLAEYKGIQKVRILNLGKADKRVFKAEGVNIFKYYSLADGSKTLKSEKIKLI